MGNVVSGARVAKGGLHLGHFLGCFQPLIQKVKNVENYIFVLNDNPMQKNDFLIEMLLDLYSIKNAFNLKEIHIVLESQLLDWCSSFYNFLTQVTTLQTLTTTIPKDENNTIPLQSVWDFLFPIKQALFSFIFDAEYYFLNDDNLRFIKFASRLGRKVNNCSERKIVIPQLITGRIPRLLGYDYRKMSKSNENAIFISDQGDVLKAKVYKLFDRSKLFAVDNNEKIKCESSNPYIYPDHFLPFVYLRAFSDIPTNEIERLKSSLLRNELRDLLTNTLTELLSNIQNHRTLIDKTTILNQFFNDSLIVKKLIDPYFLMDHTKVTDTRIS